VPTDALQASFKIVGNYLTEATKVAKANGELIIPKNEAENIQTVSDILDYFKDKKVIDTVAAELMTNLVLNPESEEVAAMIGKKDKIIAQISLGTKPDNNIGFKINKNGGVDDVSIMMVKDGDLIDSPFNKDIVNKQILYFRNFVVKDEK